MEKAKQITQFVKEIRRSQPRLGTRKLHYLWHKQMKTPLGRDRMFDVLRKAHMLVQVKRAYHKTTMSHHCFHRHPNLLKSGPLQVTANAPEQVWVADITYLPTRSGMLYVSLITDIYSRKIVGYHVHDTLHAIHVEQALKMALKERKTKGPLIHHSDRGAQYCCASYQHLSQQHGIRSSMTDGYDCYQNALAERINGILKTEFLLHHPDSLSEARIMLKEAVTIYNEQRPHTALQYKTPDAVHRAHYV